MEARRSSSLMVEFSGGLHKSLMGGMVLRMSLRDVMGLRMMSLVLRMKVLRKSLMELSEMVHRMMSLELRMMVLHKSLMGLSEMVRRMMSLELKMREPRKMGHRMSLMGLSEKVHHMNLMEHIRLIHVLVSRIERLDVLEQRVQVQFQQLVKIHIQVGHTSSMGVHKSLRVHHMMMKFHRLHDRLHDHHLHVRRHHLRPSFLVEAKFP